MIACNFLFVNVPQHILKLKLMSNRIALVKINFSLEMSETENLILDLLSMMRQCGTNDSGFPSPDVKHDDFICIISELYLVP